MSAAEVRKGKKPVVLALVLVISTLVAIAVGELAVRRMPGLLPGWYRELQPLHGVELFHPGVLASTPVDEVPLPIVAEPHDGPPPADLKVMGIVPSDCDADLERFPRVQAPVDELGLPNPRRPEKADVVFVGDSFVVSTGLSEPLGLRGQLAEATGLEVYACAYSGIGPVRELKLFERAGLPLEPDAVIWFFYGGNDIVDSMAPEYHRRLGRETYADVYADQMPPPVILFDLFRAMLTREGATPEAGDESTLPPLSLPAPDGTSTDVWLHHGHAAQLIWTKDEWRASPGWGLSTNALLKARALCEERGARFLVVYLPTRSEVYLPYLEENAELVHAMAAPALADADAWTPEAFLEAALAGRRDLEEALAEFCAAEGLEFLSATPFLEEPTARGEPTYLVGDSHWHPGGHRVLVEPLRAWLGR